MQKCITYLSSHHKKNSKPTNLIFPLVLYPTKSLHMAKQLLAGDLRSEQRVALARAYPYFILLM